jgi:hypothetical protein
MKNFSGVIDPDEIRMTSLKRKIVFKGNILQWKYPHTYVNFNQTKVGEF